MSARDDGGPAFPHLIESSQRINETEMYSGLTIRDHFAAALLPQVAQTYAECDPKYAGTVAELCYAFADAMLKERAK